MMRAIALMGVVFAGAGWAEDPAFAVIVHRSNSTQSMSYADLRSLFGGTLSHWPNQTGVVLAERDESSPAGKFLTQRLLRTSLADYKRSLENLEFKGSGPVTLRVLNSDQAACKFVFNVPAAVGLISASSLVWPECSQIRVLRIEGLMPGQEGYRLQ